MEDFKINQKDLNQLKDLENTNLILKCSNRK